MLPSFHEPRGLLWPNILEQTASIAPATLQRGEFSFLVVSNEPDVWFEAMRPLMGTQNV